MHPVTRRTSVLLAILLLVTVSPRLLNAHAHLRRSSPGTDAELDRAPRELQLWFSEQPQLPFTQVSLLAADSSAVALGSLRLGDDMSVVAPVTGTVAAGTYTVVWQTGGADGHPSRGRFSFRVRTDTTAIANGASPPAGVAAGDTSQSHDDHSLVGVTSDASSAVTARGLAAARWLEFVGILIVVGVVGFRWLLSRTALVPDARSEALDSARRLGRSAVLLLLVSALVRLHVESMAMHGARAYDAGVLQSTVLGTTWGRGWLLGVLGAIVVWLGCTLARRHNAGWLLTTIGVMAVAITPALTGHAMATPVKPAIAVVADGLHVLAAGLWLGTLTVMTFAGMPALRRAGEEAWGSSTAILVQAFSRVALTGAGVLVLSGIISAVFRLGAVDALWSSGYGRVLLLKLALFVFVLLLGARNWRRIAPGLGDRESPTRIRRSAVLELTAAALVLAATAALVAISPPDHNGGAPIAVASDTESPR